MLNIKFSVKNPGLRSIANPFPERLMRLKLVFITLIILSCNIRTDNDQNEQHQIPFQESGLKIACLGVIKTLDSKNHGALYIDSKGKQLDKDSIRNLLYSISQFDDFSQTNATCNVTERHHIYEKTNSKDKAYKLTTTAILMENPGNLPIENPIKTQIILEDFDLYLNDKIKRISIRILNHYTVIKLTIDAYEIHRLSESVPAGLEKLIHQLDSIKNEHKAKK